MGTREFSTRSWLLPEPQECHLRGVVPLISYTQYFAKQPRP